MKISLLYILYYYTNIIYILFLLIKLQINRKLKYFYFIECSRYLFFFESLPEDYNNFSGQLKRCLQSVGWSRNNDFFLITRFLVFQIVSFLLVSELSIFHREYTRLCSIVCRIEYTSIPLTASMQHRIMIYPIARRKSIATRFLKLNIESIHLYSAVLRIPENFNSF